MRISGGKGALLVLAVASVPVLLSKFKPLAKKIGKGLSNMGENLQKSGEPAAPEQPKAERKATGAHAEKAAAAKSARESKASSPTGKQEVESKQAEPEAKKASGAAGRAAVRKSKEGATAPKNNPKRTRSTK